MIKIVRYRLLACTVTRNELRLLHRSGMHTEGTIHHSAARSPEEFSFTCGGHTTLKGGGEGRRVGKKNRKHRNCKGKVRRKEKGEVGMGRGVISQYHH